MPLRTIIIKATRSGTASTVIIRRGASGTGGGGVTDHGALDGLLDSDDHTQYLNNARGDLRYQPKGTLDGISATKAQFQESMTDDDFMTLGGTQTLTGQKTFATDGILFFGDQATLALMDGSGMVFAYGSGVQFNSISYNYGTGAAAAHLAALGLGTPTGTGNVVRATSPTIISPTITGTASLTTPLPITSGGTGAANLDALQPKITSLNASAIRTDLGLNTNQSVTFAGIGLGISAGNPSVFQSGNAGTGIEFPQSGMFALYANSVRVALVRNTAIELGSDKRVSWCSGTAYDTSPDTGISRKTSTPGTLMVGNGTANNASGSIELANLTASGAVTVTGTVAANTAIKTTAGSVIGNTGGLNFADQFQLVSVVTNSDFGLVRANIARIVLGQNGVGLRSDGVVGWAASTSADAVKTCGISPISTGSSTLGIGTGASGNTSGSLSLTNLTASGAIILPTSTTPTSAGAAGVAGTIVRDANYLYVCTATNTWTRIALAW